MAGCCIGLSSYISCRAAYLIEVHYRGLNFERFWAEEEICISQCIGSLRRHTSLRGRWARRAGSMWGVRRHVLTSRPAGFHLRVTRLRLPQLSIAARGRLLRAENGLFVVQDGYPRPESPDAHLPTMRAVGLYDCSLRMGTAQAEDALVMSVWELDGSLADSTSFDGHRCSHRNARRGKIIHLFCNKFHLFGDESTARSF